MLDSLTCVGCCHCCCGCFVVCCSYCVCIYSAVVLVVLLIVVDWDLVGCIVNWNRCVLDLFAFVLLFVMVLMGYLL